MDMKIVNDHSNKLLDRREVSFEIKHEGKTPSRKEIQALLAAKLTVDDKLVIINPLIPIYGGSFIKGSANIYKKPEEMKKIETAPMIKRNFPEEAKKEGASAEAAAAPAQAPAPAAPAKKEAAK